MTLVCHQRYIPPQPDDEYKARRAMEFARAGRYNTALLEAGAIIDEVLRLAVIVEVLEMEAR